MALAAAVLPDPDESAKDMGVLNIGNALPQSLVPIAAPALLATGGGGNYGGPPSSSSAPSGKPSPSNSPLL
ncbi:hypothetical protein ACFY13_38245 [Streptomyces mirabilis]|uniref:hypothetical protein n=1 Tax=Streptomyces mirabilis TaxID=68239 RepID=UPI003680343A